MSEYRFGAWRFRDIEVSENAKIDPDFRPQVECMDCKRILLKKTMKAHVEVHDRREESKLASAARRELGLRKIKVLKGQQGLF